MEKESEWEVVDDDGFIYKRRKGKAVVSSPATITKTREVVLSERTQLRRKETLIRRKKMAMLVAQKDMYAAEIAEWENVLKRQENYLSYSPIFHSPPSSEQVTVRSVEDATANGGLQILQVQVEAYEGFCEQLKSLCDHGESVCTKLEMEVEASRKHVEQGVIQEVVKFTPRTIFHSLTSNLALPIASCRPSSEKSLAPEEGKC